MKTTLRNDGYKQNHQSSLTVAKGCEQARVAALRTKTRETQTI